MDTAIGISELIDGRYRLLERVGVGGMSTVYRARDEQLEREVAIKVFPAEIATDEDERRRRDEVRLLGSIVHPALVTLYDARLTHDPPYLSLEFVEGEDLRTRLTRGPLALDSIATLGAAVADALAAIHERGIVHRDLKPGNILLPATAPRTGVAAKLGDFGIARLVDSTRVTADGTLIGTAAYLSPEQAANRPVGPPSDVYSLGLVLLECLTCRPAFEGNAVEAATARITSSPAIPDDLPRPLASLLARMTDLHPDTRPTARDVARSLSGAASEESTRTMEEPTRRLPAPADASAAAPSTPATATTAADAPALPVASTAATSTTPAATTPDSGTPAQDRPGRRGVRVLAWVAAALLAAIVAVALAVTFLPRDETTPPAYPPVEGELGEHLEQLQRTVDP